MRLFKLYLFSFLVSILVGTLFAQVLISVGCTRQPRDSNIVDVPVQGGHPSDRATGTWEQINVPVQPRSAAAPQSVVVVPSRPIARSVKVHLSADFPRGHVGLHPAQVRAAAQSVVFVELVEGELCVAFFTFNLSARDMRDAGSASARSRVGYGFATGHGFMSSVVVDMSYCYRFSDAGSL